MAGEEVIRLQFDPRQAEGVLDSVGRRLMQTGGVFGEALEKSVKGFTQGNGFAGSLLSLGHAAMQGVTSGINRTPLGASNAELATNIQGGVTSSLIRAIPIVGDPLAAAFDRAFAKDEAPRQGAIDDATAYLTQFERAGVKLSQNDRGRVLQTFKARRIREIELREELSTMEYGTGIRFNADSFRGSVGH